ncbi:BTAD domain-containing putative transcriptional regulator [Actinomycetes bacterium KLBMP 9797]
MRFRVLGPVEVEAGGRLLDIGPRQRRIVLAALAVDAGTPVHIDTLAERVWGSAAPDAPRSALYAHVTRLRRVLAHAAETAAAPVSLSRQGVGYVLEVDPQQVDLHRFQALVKSSRTARPEDRMSLLRAALDLWRGPPLPTSSGDWAARLRASLESQFVGAITAWATEQLQLGDPEPVVDRLAQVLAGHPHAEPLVALLMRALCAVGRTAEALQWYADTRQRVADQLGVEPSPELRQLHVAILRGELDRAPAPEEAVSAPASAAALRQLPADLSRFTGRGDELATVDRWAATDRSDGSPAVLAIHGAAGTGKSAFAVHAAHRLARASRDGQLYLDLRGSVAGASPLAPAEGLARLLRACGVPVNRVPSDPDEAAALFRSMVAGRHMLLVLDNAVTAGQVRPLLPGDACCLTLVTSRAPLVGLGDVGHLTLGPLTASESLGLLGRWVGAARVVAEPAAAAAIVRTCEGLPVALCAVAARLVARPRWPLAELARRLADPAGRLDHLEFEGTGVRASLGASLQLLEAGPHPGDRAAAAAFAILGVACDAGFDLGLAARVLSRSVVDTEALLERLVDAQLLESTGPGAYAMAELPRAYARERAAARPQWLADALPSGPRPRQAGDN